MFLHQLSVYRLTAPGIYHPCRCIIPLDADQFARVVRCIISGERDQETVTRQDLTEFSAFFFEQPKSHTSELSSKFEKASIHRVCVILNRLKSRAKSNFIMLVTKGTRSSTLKFWIIPKAFW